MKAVVLALDWHGNVAHALQIDTRFVPLDDRFALLRIAAGSRRPRDPPAGDSDMRPYKDGPLTPDDFRHPLPDPRPEMDGLRLRATTFTWILLQHAS